MRKLALIAILIFGTTVAVSAQVFVQNTMYSFNRFVYNPAAAGMKQPGTEYRSNLTLVGRQQWLGIPGAPRMMSASYATLLPEDWSSGAGIYAMRDELGPISTTGLNVAYAYHIKLRPDSDGPRISIGVNGGFLQKAINGEFIYNEQSGIDPLVPLGGYSAGVMVPSLGAGVFYKGADDKYFVGLSGQDLLEPSIEDLLLTSGIGPDSRVARSFFLMGGYRFDFDNNMSLEPNVFLRTDGILPPQLDISVYWRYRPVVVGLSRRFFNDSFSGIVGFNVLDRAFIGYSYDYTTNALNFAGDVHSHEIIVSWSFPSPEEVRRKNVDIRSGNPDDIN